MKTLDRIIQESREFACEFWGKGEAGVVFYAPVTRIDGVTWVHPAWAKEATWDAITRRAARIWQVSGSLWNPVGFRLIWRDGPVVALAPEAASIVPEGQP